MGIHTSTQRRTLWCCSSSTVNHPCWTEELNEMHATWVNIINHYFHLKHRLGVLMCSVIKIRLLSHGFFEIMHYVLATFKQSHLYLSMFEVFSIFICSIVFLPLVPSILSTLSPLLLFCSPQRLCLIIQCAQDEFKSSN